MKYRAILVVFILLQLLTAAGLPASALGKALFVTSEYRTIQQAIDAASFGDVVCVGPGTYTEALVMKEGVSVLGSGHWLTHIDLGADTIGVLARDGCRVSGLSIEEGIIGIDCTGDNIEISDNYIQSRYVGIRAVGASPTIANNVIEAVYACIMTKDGGAPHIHNNDLHGRYWGISSDNTSPFVHNNRIADFEQGIYTISSNALILNNEVINSLYDGIVMTRDSGCFLSNNTLVGHMERGVSIFDSWPMLCNNIITENEVGVYCWDSAPIFSYNCVASNRQANYDGVSAGLTDISDRPLLIGVGEVSSISGANDDVLVCAAANWVRDSLVGRDLVPDTTAMCLEYGGQDRLFKVVSNTRTSITVEVDLTEANYTTLLKRTGSSDEPYTQAGDTFFVDDVGFQTVGAGWADDSPCIDAGDPDPIFNDPDGTRDDMGVYGGPYAGTVGACKAPLVSLRSLEQVYKTGETVNVLADLTNNQKKAVQADLLIVAFLEGSPQFYSYPNWTPGLNPVPYSLSADDSQTIPVLVMSASALPRTDYRFLAAFAKSGTMQLISPISELWFKVRPD